MTLYAPTRNRPPTVTHVADARRPFQQSQGRGKDKDTGVVVAAPIRRPTKAIPHAFAALRRRARLTRFRCRREIIMPSRSPAPGLFGEIHRLQDFPRRRVSDPRLQRQTSSPAFSTARQSTRSCDGEIPISAPNPTRRAVWSRATLGDTRRSRRAMRRQAYADGRTMPRALRGAHALCISACPYLSVGNASGCRRSPHWNANLMRAGFGLNATVNGRDDIAHWTGPDRT